MVDESVGLGGETKGQRLNISRDKYILVLTSELTKVIDDAEGYWNKKLLNASDQTLMTVTRSQNQKGRTFGVHNLDFRS